jgi:alkylation response protein AidB-like acyl-CoA dehydrogenase
MQRGTADNNVRRNNAPRERLVNFDLTEDDEILKALVERFVMDRYDISRRRSYLDGANGYSETNWQLFAELGLISALLPSGSGGLGLGATGLAALFEALGAGLVVEPVLENVLLAGRLLATTAPAALSAELLPKVLDGRARVALAHAEAKARGHHLWVETRAEADGDGFVLSGEKAFVPAGAGVDGFIVSARTSGMANDLTGVLLVYVPANSAGVVVQRWQMADGSAAVSLKFDAVRVARELRLSGGLAQIAEAQELANLARAAEAIGIMGRMFAETSDYLRSREQFGSKLASFQALQHRMVAQYAALEQCRALLNLALVSAGTEQFASAVRGARAYISAASLTFGHEMIQFHGGMGVSDDLAIGHGHKRLLLLSRWPDDPEAALDAYAEIAA